MAWTGDPNNPVPNIGNVKSDLSQKIAQDSPVLSDKLHDINRAKQTRRDTDKQKDNTVTLMDIDNAILTQLQKFQLTVKGASQIKVPIYYASPEKWKSIQYDGVIRDYNGKLILPALVFQRTTSEKDTAMMMFNRYLTYPVMRVYSEKNRYTPFAALVGQNKPVHEVYDVIMPDHMVFTYHFIVWTEYVEQMNTIIERINFETEDYWGELRGLRFRTKIDSFSHTSELQVDQDRMVKTEFDLLVNGYLLPDVIDRFQGNRDTTRKWFTPKKVIFGMEVVGTGFNPSSLDNNKEKWRNQNYPNLPADININAPTTEWCGDISIDLLSKCKAVVNISSNKITSPPGIQYEAVPSSPNSPGVEGNMAYDSKYLYVYTKGIWKRMPLDLFS
jgi:hypothetical protein